VPWENDAQRRLGILFCYEQLQSVGVLNAAATVLAHLLAPGSGRGENHRSREVADSIHIGTHQHGSCEYSKSRGNPAVNYQNLAGPLITPDRIAFRTSSMVTRPPGAVPPHSKRVAAGR